MRYFAVGDIHGELDMLKSLIEKLEPNKEDQFVFIGDYIDRGPDPKGVIDFLIEFNKTHNCVFIRGNHEVMFFDFLQRSNEELFRINGGDVTLKSYGANIFEIPSMPEEHMQFFKQTQVYYETEHIIFVHAGIDPNTDSLSEMDIEWFIWAREEFFNDPFVPDKLVVFGHTPMNEVTLKRNKLAIDTGAVYGGKLTCCILSETGDLQKVEQVSHG